MSDVFLLECNYILKMRATVSMNGSVTTNKGFANGVNPLGYATSDKSGN